MPSQLPDEKNRETFESVSIWGECGEFSVPGSFWLTVLEVAQRYGWKAAGTNPPDPEYFEDLPASLPGDVLEFDFSEFYSWGGHDGGYYPPNGQQVTQEDAKNLAQALERALPDIPGGATEREGREQDVRGLRIDDPFAGWCERSSSLMQRLGAIRPTLEGLIKHCRECGELWLC
jgi:hypothetical protein